MEHASLDVTGRGEARCGTCLTTTRPITPARSLFPTVIRFSPCFSPLRPPEKLGHDASVNVKIHLDDSINEPGSILKGTFSLPVVALHCKSGEASADFVQCAPFHVYAYSVHILMSKSRTFFLNSNLLPVLIAWNAVHASGSCSETTGSNWHTVSLARPHNNPLSPIQSPCWFADRACSGHGLCQGEPARCLCEQGFSGNTCELKLCPTGPSWADSPGSVHGQEELSPYIALYSRDLRQSSKFPSLDPNRTVLGGRTLAGVSAVAGQAHYHSVCSGRGQCDTNLGVCNCMAGFTGSACQHRENLSITACNTKCSPLSILVMLTAASCLHRSQSGAQTIAAGTVSV